jgi:hypothetical protein
MRKSSHGTKIRKVAQCREVGKEGLTFRSIRIITQEFCYKLILIWASADWDFLPSTLNLFWLKTCNWSAFQLASKGWESLDSVNKIWSWLSSQKIWFSKPGGLGEKWMRWENKENAYRFG